MDGSGISEAIRMGFWVMFVFFIVVVATAFFVGRATIGCACDYRIVKVTKDMNVQ